MPIRGELIEGLCVGSSDFTQRIWPCFSLAVIEPFTFGSIPFSELTPELERRVSNDKVSGSETVRLVVCDVNGHAESHEELRRVINAYISARFLLCGHDAHPPLQSRASYCCLNGEDHVLVNAIRTTVSDQILGPR